MPSTRDALERLLAVSDNPMTLLQQYHETYLEETAEEARKRAIYLRPEHEVSEKKSVR